ncbi:hypothetical protein [Marinagarivorans algicola]|uniref:hypothetical protein n=1 Tax=Marinagarivorans algicola TaxID=1513270 RepID=UPI0037358835
MKTFFPSFIFFLMTLISCSAYTGSPSNFGNVIAEIKVTGSQFDSVSLITLYDNNKFTDSNDDILWAYNLVRNEFQYKLELNEEIFFRLGKKIVKAGDSWTDENIYKVLYVSEDQIDISLKVINKEKKLPCKKSRVLSETFFNFRVDTGLTSAFSIIKNCSDDKIVDIVSYDFDWK